MPSAEPNELSSMAPDLVEIIRAKRDGEVLGADAIAAMVDAMSVPGGVADSQLAAFAMAVLLRGMNASECAALTRSMTHSGTVLDWRPMNLPGPCIDKHSTGGVGDKVSLLLAPMLAACGAFVPMVSGRGLGHTGGTLDKLEAIPGYVTRVDPARLREVVRDCGCAIVAASEEIAPADARLYAVRDITATVESVALITASILSKKLAAGIDALVMDVKFGNGAFAAGRDAALELSRSLVSTAAQAGLPVVALLTDMNQVLGDSAGNALEVHEVVRALRNEGVDPRLEAVTLALGVEALVLGGLHTDPLLAREHLLDVLRSGAAAERFERMVMALGGSARLLDAPAEVLPAAPVRRDVCSPRAGWIHSVDTRALGLAVVHLGGGRRLPDDSIDAAVGIGGVASKGVRVEAGQPLATIHARSADDADAAAMAVGACFGMADEPGARDDAVAQRVTGETVASA